MEVQAGTSKIEPKLRNKLNFDQKPQRKKILLTNFTRVFKSKKIISKFSSFSLKIKETSKNLFKCVNID